ncbi:MAG: succinate dehydrogenase, hydrophobic membrane anchor protein [Geminicoccaceae bacterium]
MTLQTPIARVRGLGAARAGTRRWMAERLTGIASLILVLWFVFSAMALAGADYAQTRAWLASPVAATLMILLILSVFYHAQLGLQVVIEDYVHHSGLKVAAMVAVTLGLLALGAACIVAVLQVSIGS